MVENASSRPLCSHGWQVRGRGGDQSSHRAHWPCPRNPRYPLAEEDQLLAHRDGANKDPKVPPVRKEVGHSALS